MLTDETSIFERFCLNLSGNSKERKDSLESIIGYLLHRNHDPSNSRAVIFIDENITFDGAANGGTGKSLLVSAIGHCRELVVIDGKGMKSKSTFKNQRINRTTDVIFYDDVRKEFSLEELYSMITTGIVVEKKYKPEEFITPENSPKIVISSNYVVNGTGGSTDIRRRCEFEVSAHYSESYTPQDEFKCLFFIGWDDLEWSRFFMYMMKCAQVYLAKGLVPPQPINLKKNKLINSTSMEFVSFIQINAIQTSKWYCKSRILDLFHKDFENRKDITMNKMTKWFKEYAKQEQLTYRDRKSGEKYEFYLSPNNIKDGHEEEK